MSGPRLGEPIEVPWWVLVAAVPPAAVIAGAVLVPGPGVARAVGAVFSALLVWILVGVSTRVASTNMQSVWVSAAYGIWFFPALIWLVSALHH